MEHLNKKKILFIIPSLEPGGMERVMSELVNYLAISKEEEIHLLMYGRSRELFYKLSNKVILHPLDINYRTNKIRLGLNILFSIRKKVKQISPNSILSFGEIWNNIVLLSLYGLQYPIFVSDRSEPGKKLGKINAFLRQKLYPNATGMIAQTVYAKNIYSNELNVKNIHVIGNPIKDFSDICYTSRENIVLTVGRLIETKQHEALIKLFIEINNPSWKLYIVGGEHGHLNLSHKLNNIILDNGFEDRIFLKGKSENIKEAYNKAKIFAFPSSSEGFPNVVGEAMSSGLAVIAFDRVVGPSGLVNHSENGILVPYLDFDRFKKDLKKLMEDEKLINNLSSFSKLTIKKFNIENIGEQYYNILKVY